MGFSWWLVVWCSVLCGRLVSSMVVLVLVNWWFSCLGVVILG